MQEPIIAIIVILAQTIIIDSYFHNRPSLDTTPFSSMIRPKIRHNNNSMASVCSEHYNYKHFVMSMILIHLYIDCDEIIGYESCI